MEINRIDKGFELLYGEKLNTHTSEGKDFAKVLEEFVNWVNQQQKHSKEVKEAILAGEDVPLHQMIVEFEKAGVALNLLIEIRNRLLEGFQDLMRMQV